MINSPDINEGGINLIDRTVDVFTDSTITETVDTSDALVVGIGMTLIESVDFSADLGNYELGIALNEAVAALATISDSVGTIDGSITEVLALQQTIRLGIGIALTESTDLSASVAEILTLIASITEQLAAANSELLGQQISAAVIVSLAVADALSTAFAAQVTSTMDVSDAVIARIRFLLALTEATVVTDTVTDVLTLVATFTETTAVSDTLAGQLSISDALTEALSVGTLITFGSDQYVGWVVNAEGAFPASQYTPWPFNSYAGIHDDLYAVAEDGLYQITGDDDAGVDIDAYVLTGKLDMGTDKQKRMPDIALGYTADDKMRLYVRTEDGGELKEYWYEAVAITADTPREHVIQLGRGLKSLYWQFKLLNTSGADFHVDVVRLYPIILTRRR